MKNIEFNRLEGSIKQNLGLGITFSEGDVITIREKIYVFWPYGYQANAIPNYYTNTELKDSPPKDFSITKTKISCEPGDVFKYTNLQNPMTKKYEKVFVRISNNNHQGPEFTKWISDRPYLYSIRKFK